MAVNRLDAIRDPNRLNALRSTGLPGTPPEESFDRITRLATRALRVSIALFCLVDASQQYLKSQQGLAEPWASRRELPLTHSLCWLVVATGEPLAVSDARQHPWLADNPIVTDLGFVAYLGVPITVGGYVIGTLAVIDRQARQWSDDEVRALEDLGAITEIEARRSRPSLEVSPLIQSVAGVDARIRLLDALGDGVCAVDPSGTCIYINQIGARLLGYRPEEIVGQSIHAMIHHSYPDGSPYPVGDVPLMRSMATGEALRVESEVLWRRNLTPLAVRYSSFPIVEGRQIVGGLIVFTDATERRRAEDERERLLAREHAARLEAESAQQRLSFLSQASARLAASLDETTNLRDVIQLIVPHLADWCTIDLIDETGTMRRAEAAHRDSSKAELLRVMPDWLADGPRWQQSVSKAILSGQAEVVTEVTDRDLFTAARDPAQLQMLRSIGCRSYLCAPLVARGKTFGAITIAQVESSRSFLQFDRFFAEDLARRIASAIDTGRLYREARDAIQVRNEFLVTVAHDLRNPLANIKGYSQLLLRSLATPKDAQEEERLSWLQRVDATTTRMTAQIDELLDLARVQIGQPLELERRPLNLVTMARQTVEAYQQTTGHPTVRLETALSNVIGFWDARRLERVLANLVSNAIKYSGDDGEVTITVGTEDIDGRPWAVLSVRDNGIGIPAVDLPHIFERFYRGHNVTERSVGSGVGLASVYQIVTHHGGIVDVTSEEGVGTTFTIRLPLNASATATTGE